MEEMFKEEKCCKDSGQVKFHRLTNQHTKCMDIRLSDVYVRH